MGALVLGYSGGVDSSFLAKVAQEELGENAVALVALSESYAERERESALVLAEQIGIRVRTVDTRELENPDYAANPSNRCYYCKVYNKVHASIPWGIRTYFLLSPKSSHHPTQPLQHNSLYPVTRLLRTVVTAYSQQVAPVYYTDCPRTTIFPCTYAYYIRITNLA